MQSASDAFFSSSRSFSKASRSTARVARAGSFCLRSVNSSVRSCFCRSAAVSRLAWQSTTVLLIIGSGYKTSLTEETQREHSGGVLVSRRACRVVGSQRAICAAVCGGCMGRRTHRGKNFVRENCVFEDKEPSILRFGDMILMSYPSQHNGATKG
jgi:hypothetical protein